MDLKTELRHLEELIASGKLESAKLHYRTITDQLRCGAEQEEQVVLELVKAQILAGEDRYKDAIEVATHVLERARELNLRDKVARCHLLLSAILLRTGDYIGARSHAEACVYFANWEINDRAFEGDAHINLGLALKNLGSWDEAERHLRQAIRAYGSSSDNIRRLRASLNLAILLRKMGKVSEASEVALRALNKARLLSVPIGIVRCSLELANIAVIEGDIDQGRLYLDGARRVIATEGYQREDVLACEIEGDLEVLSGNYRKALDIFRAALKVANSLASGGDIVAELLRRAASVSLALRRLRSARNYVEEALTINEETQDRYERAVCLRILGQVEIATGMTGKGIGHLEQAVSELSRLSNWSPELAIAEGELGKALLSYPDTAYGAAAQHLLIARRIYSSLGISSAVRDLDDLILSAITVKRASKKERSPLEGNVSIVSRSRLDPRKFGMVTEDERIVGDLERWGPTEARILIEGETGVGKEVMARALHAMSRRREGPFVTVDCGALNETLADSELFGHARGAFTGAMRDRVGLIEEAGGGTLFLDEIGELSTALQVKLLRVLEEGVVRRVGENVARPVDVRVICATARNLWAEVETGNFRRDLYYRLKTALIRIPSLKERPYDIEPLMQYYLDFYCKRYGKHLTLDRTAIAELTRYDWPGNVRELKNFAEALVISKTDGVIVAADIIAVLRGSHNHDSLKRCLDETERDAILRALRLCQGNRTRAAKMLGISRKTLWQKLKRL